MIREAKEIFSGMTAWEIIKEVCGCTLAFLLMWQLVFLSTLMA